MKLANFVGFVALNCLCSANGDISQAVVTGLEFGSKSNRINLIAKIKLINVISRENLQSEKR